MYSKVYNVGRLTFKVEVQGPQPTSGCLTLTRLPVVPATSGPEVSYHNDQMCNLYFKPAVTEDAVEHGVTNEEFIEMCKDNAGFESKHFVVAEYTGRDGSSENLTPDTALDGFLECEIERALQILEEDDKLIAYLTDNAVERLLVIG